MRRDRTASVVGSLMVRFNPRAYMRRDENLGQETNAASGFNPRAYMRRDKQVVVEREKVQVSIHAPT